MIRGIIVLLAGAFCSIPCVARAADVSIEVSAQETYVGLPVEMQISIEAKRGYDPPEIPQVDGLEIRSAGPPSRSSQISVINGQTAVNINRVIYRYQITPERAGSFTIPPIQIKTGQQRTATKAVRIVASESETGDLLFVEISGAKSKVFVGQATTLKLKIWLRPFTSRVYNVTLNEADMWNLLSDNTSWGPFEDRMRQLESERKRPGGESVIRKDSAGEEHEYLRYEIDAEIYPDRPGKIDGRDVQIVFDYPEALGGRRSALSLFDDDPYFSSRRFPGFGPRLAVKKIRPIVAEATVDDLVIEPIPTEGRPDDYRGAVGQYTITTEATPTVVQAGDPITLRIDIGGTGPMDSVRAPPLAATGDFTRDFRVADDALSGVVSDTGKRFTTTIRPNQSGIEQIPAIRFSYFDPEREEFVTARSQPIAIQVGAAEQLDLANIVGSSAAGTTGTGARSGQATQQNGSLDSRSNGVSSQLDLRTNVRALQSKPPAPLIDQTTIAFLIAPALFFFGGVLFRLSRWMPSGMFAERRFRRAVEAADSKAAIAEATEAFLCERYGIPSDADPRDHSVGALRGRGHSDIAIRIERLYNSAHPSSRNDGDIETWRREAIEVIADLKARRQRRLVASTALLLAIASPSPLGAQGFQPSTDQQTESFASAVDDYRVADYPSAERKFRQLVESGIHNDSLYFNLGLACEQQGKIGNAIANYRRALRIEPEQSEYHDRLSRLDASQTTRLPRQIISPLLYVAWPIFCVSATYLVFRRSPSMLGVCICALFVCLASGAVRLRDRLEFTRDDVAVVVQPELPIHQGDGPEYEVIHTLDHCEGTLLTLVASRAGWSKIRDPDGRSGWVRAENLVAIE